MSDNNYIRVKKREDEEIYKLPLEEDGTLSLSTLQNHFPGASGLLYKQRKMKKRKKVRLENGKLYTPSNTDPESSIFYCIFDESKPLERENPKLSASYSKKDQQEEDLKAISDEKEEEQIHENNKIENQSSHTFTENNTQPAYSVLPGTIDRGRDYECIVLSRLILELVLDNQVKDFKACLNNEDFLPFDDVIIEKETADTTENYAIQLKHSNASGKTLTVFELRRANDINVNKYFQKLKEEEFRKLANYKWFLFTNRISNYEENTVFRLEKENLDIKIMQCETDPLFKKSFENNFSYKFQSSEPLENQQYLSNFFLYTNQPNADQMEEQLAQRFQEAFDCEKTAFLEFYNFICDWNKKDGARQKLTKKWIKEVIATILLSPQVEPLVSDNSKINEKLNIFRKCFDKFDIIIFEKTNWESVARFWNIKKEIEDVGLQEIDNLRSKYRTIFNCERSVDDLTELESSKILWLLEKCPLVIKYKENITKAIRLCENKKFIVVYDKSLNENIRNSFEKMSVFQNLHDLKEETSCYEEVVKTFCCSIQGKAQITLETLINDSEHFQKCLTTNNLLLFLNDQLVIGEEKDELNLYIPRSFSRHLIEEYFLETYNDDTILIIDCLEETSKYSNRFEIKEIETILNSSSDQIQLQLRYQKKILYVSSNRCNRRHIDELCKKIDCDQFHHFRVFGTKLEWISSLAPTKNLKEYLTKEDYFVGEEEFDNATDDSDTIIFCGDPGLGKTTLMQKFKRTTFPSSWTVILQPKDHSRHLKEIKGDIYKFEKYILDESAIKYCGFDFEIFEILLKTGRVNYIWDGLDEISENSLNVVLDMIEALSKKGVKQCLTSRNNLREDLENRFCVLAKTIREFDEEEQKCYIRKRLRCEDTKLEELFTKISNQINFFKYKDILSIPLQIFMFTELLLQDPEKYNSLLDNMFSLTDLYEHFIDVKFNIYFEEKENQKDFNDYAIKRRNKDKEQRIMQYQLVALKTYFPNESFEKSLNHETLLSELRIKDEFGIITSVNSDGLVNFLHNSYGEYFTALYFSRNYQNIQNLQFLFMERNKNIRFMFDLILAKGYPAHVATLCQNLQLLTSYENELLHSDAGGRSALHLACSWGETYPPLDVKKEVKRKWFMKKTKYYVYASRLSRKESPEYVEILNYLLKHCNREQEDRVYKFKPLLYADETSNLFALSALLDTYVGPVKNFKCFQNISSLLSYSAAYHFDNIIDHVKQIPFLTYVQDQSFFSFAAYCGSLSICRKILAKNIWNRGYISIDEALVRACCGGHVDVANFLIEKGADINFIDDSKKTAILETCHYGHADVAQLLVDKGADINSANQDGITPLFEACRHNNYGVADVLIKGGADINTASTWGITPLLAACYNGFVDLFKLLIEAGADINIVDANEKTPLNAACLNGHLDIADLLIKAGADINIVDCDGKSPLNVARDEGHDDVVDLLIEAGAEFGTAEKDEEFQLFMNAYDNGHIDDLGNIC